MAEERISHLCKITSLLNSAQSSNHNTLSLLKCYYIMKCHDVTTIKLRNKQFSPNIRCVHCCNQWSQGNYEVLNSVKISKKYRKRLKNKKIKNQIIKSHSMIRICNLCKHKTVIPLQKSEDVNNEKGIHVAVKDNIVLDKQNKPPEKKKNKKPVVETNLYSNTRDVFSLKTNKNILNASVKETPKIIKNNKKKKDKFAGLCKEAVLASAKLLETKKKQDKINLFLKPTS